MKKIVLKNCRVLNFNQATPYLADIVIDRNGRIEKIIEGRTKISGNYEVIDCHNHYVMPGLINAHSHLFASGKPFKGNLSPSLKNVGYRLLQTKLGHTALRMVMHKNAQTQLQSGITTIRSLGEFFYQDVQLRDTYLSKKKIGPTLQVAGFFLSITDGHGAPYLALESDSPWEGRQNVRKNLKQNVDWIKICVTGGVTDAVRIGEAGSLQFTEEEITAICEEAHKVGRMVSAHVESTEGVRIALRAGVDSIEHGSPMDEEIIELYKNNPKSYRGYTTLVPTFQAAAPFALLEQEKTGVSTVTLENGKIVYEGMLESLHQAIEHGISIGSGNDASMSFVTHYDYWRELDHFVRYGGMTTRQALEIGTIGNAKLLGIEEEYGSIEVGKMADLIVLSENPLKEMRALTSVEMVFKEGQLVKKKEVKKYPKIDQLLNSY
ncbi:hypothetical protein A5844_001703 [Enterococcus sp. 10A9_DIV0425]|uniref:Amidohydrolase-related domain-containing protein n=1 Tax=Candidatus Enterococcus wittei TaxID=1987383 RepID=A0A242JXG4_9ENTE|nr:amidohydrolase family protein [Enterococcus sp. 10A9_DIV0425]OTP10006.1 hypothetical protein A5844_001703 [Enterococcus sp. 10A9_DIV0425]THE12062.1 amidohydrolase family protein [Enterococcus hirae]